MLDGVHEGEEWRPLSRPTVSDYICLHGEGTCDDLHQLFQRIKASHFVALI